MTEEKITYPDIAAEIKQMQDKEQSFIQQYINSKDTDPKVYKEMIKQHTQK